MSAPAPRRLVTVVLAIAGGFLTDTAFPMRGWWPMAFVGIALLVLALRRDSARWAAAVGMLWGLAFFLPHIWWAQEALGNPVPWAGLSVLQSGFVAATCAALVWTRRAPWLRDRPLLQAPALGIIWAVAEQGRQVWPFGGFPWGRIAFSQTDGPLVSLASIAGAPLVSAVVVAGGALLAVALVALRDRLVRRGLVAVAAVAAAIGISLVIPLPGEQTEGTLRVGAVQGNVAEPGLGAFNNALEVVTNHSEGTIEMVEEVGAGELDLVIWPENSSDFDPRVDARAEELVTAAAEAAQAPVLLGTSRYTTAPEARFNEMVLWTPGGGPTFAYAKQIPAAFAEYIPMRDIARIFSSAVDLVQVDMVPGTETAVVPVPVERLGRSVEVGTIICFEVAYDALNRDSVTNGAQVLFVPTNNASFGFTAESEQQLAMSRFRAVEHGRATVQISTVGVSGVIAPDGEVLETTELFTPDQMVAELPLRSELTISDRLGDAPIIVLTALTALGLAIGVVTGRRRAEPT